MKIMIETTKWADRTPNHVYVFTDSMSHIVAYVPAGSRRLFKFKQPIMIDRRGRQFEVLEDSEPEPMTAWQFEGSKGNRYQVTGEAQQLVCTCPGYTYRGHCRHVAQIQQQNL